MNILAAQRSKFGSALQFVPIWGGFGLHYYPMYPPVATGVRPFLQRWARAAGG